MKNRFTLFLLLLLCSEGIAKGKDYGEFRIGEPGPTLCQSALRLLGKPVDYFSAHPDMLIGGLIIAVVAGTGALLHQQFRIDAEEHALGAEVQTILKEAPPANENREITPEDLAYAIRLSKAEIAWLNSGNVDRRHNAIVEHIKQAKRDPYLWHILNLQELTAIADNPKLQLRRYGGGTRHKSDVVKILEAYRKIREALILESLHDPQVPLETNLGYNYFGAFSETAKMPPLAQTRDLQRLLARPAQVTDRPQQYLEIVASSLARQESELFHRLEAEIVEALENHELPLHENLGYDDSHWEIRNRAHHFGVHKSDLERLLKRPATVDYRSESYREIVAESLADLESAAFKSEAKTRKTKLAGLFFHKDEREKQQRETDQFIQENFSPQYGTGGLGDTVAMKAFFLKLLDKAKPGQTLGELIQENGVKLFAFSQRELFRAVHGTGDEK